MSVEFKCPSCGKKLFSYEQRIRKYGEILKECKKCGAEYLDPRYHELAVEGIPEDEFKYTPYLLMIVVGVLLIWRALHLLRVYQLGVPREIQWLLPVMFLMIGIAAIIGAVISMISIKTGRKKIKFEKLLEESKERMKDAGYVTTIRRLGYTIPENMASYHDREDMASYYDREDT